MIILNEREWVENAIQERTIGKKPTETLYRIAKYYFEEGYSKKDVRRFLDNFLLQCDQRAMVYEWGDRLDKIANWASKNKLIVIDYISISETEMQKIDELFTESRTLPRLAFTLLCIAKFKSITSNADGWVNNNDSEIMALANIKASVKFRSNLFSQLRDKGLISFSRQVDNTSVKICFMDDNKSEAIRVSDFRNLGNQYLKYKGEAFFECENCGITTKKGKSCKPRKYCPDCSKIVQARQNKESVYRLR
ncbi:hypothetical protein [Leyella stercorea]|uniref:hypothetical protein n=1 Tax=Leyella stercorea TaxID=363265 RepID=UPI0024301A4D|nr:hypothetical protein [Leyella stercorea]